MNTKVRCSPCRIPSVGLLESTAQFFHEFRRIARVARRLLTQELPRETQRLSIRQLGRRRPKILLPDSSNPQQDSGQPLGPTRIFLALNCRFQLMVKSLHHSIRLRMIHCCPQMQRSRQLVYLTQKMRLKLPSLVRRNSKEHSKTTNPSLVKCSSHSLCFLIAHRKCLWPSSESIDACQAIRLPSETGIIIMSKWTCSNLLDGVANAPRGAETWRETFARWYTGPSPLPAVRSHRRPDVALCHEFSGRFNPRVSQIVNRIKRCPPIRLR